MKKRTKIILLIAAVIVGIIAYRVIRESISYTYRMQQPMENVECVKIWIHPIDDNMDRELAAEMDAKDGCKFLTELQNLKCKYSYNSSVAAVIFGSIYAEITYIDGQQEMFGEYTNGWTDEAGKIEYGGYYFPGEKFYDLLEQYT